MFRPTDPQRSIFESEFLVPPEKAARLKKSWAEPFRRLVVPAINEEAFRDAYSSTTGRPNKSVRVLVCLHLLKEWHNLTDAQVIEQFEFNLQWHYALGVAPEAAHVSQKTLHNFRVRLMENERAQKVFEDVTRALVEADGIGVGQQRLDSTHVISNIAQLTRLGLFVETVTRFLRDVQREFPEKLEKPSGYRKRYLERDGYFSDATRDQARRRLPVVARDVYALLTLFAEDEAISGLPSYGLMRRLFDEQCELKDDEPGGEGGSEAGGDDGEAEAEQALSRVALRPSSDIKSTTLQSPYDPDATYGHKGKGYEVQVAETYGDENAYQLITATSVNGAHESDQRALIPMLGQLEEAGMKPFELLADTGYGSGANIITAAQRDVELVAPVQDPDAPKRPEHFDQPIASSGANPAPRSSSSELRDLQARLAGFTFDTTCHELLCCPQGHSPLQQYLTNGRLEVRFDAEVCTGCPNAEGCPTRPLKSGARRISRAPKTIATELRQVDQQLPDFKDRYRKRSGIESTNAELKGKHGLDDLRVRGRPRVTLVVHLKALALNVKRAVTHHARLLASAEMPEAIANPV